MLARLPPWLLLVLLPLVPLLLVLLLLFNDWEIDWMMAVMLAALGAVRMRATVLEAQRNDTKPSIRRESHSVGIHLCCSRTYMVS